jgi:Flp pilus assembly protein TadG
VKGGERILDSIRTLPSKLTPRRPAPTDERGVALIEFALVLPLILLLLIAMVDFGKAFNYWNDETHLANEAARYAVVNKNPLGGSSLEAAIKQDADSAELRNGCSSCSIRSPGITVSFCFVQPDPTDPTQPLTTAGAPLRATVTSTYHWLAYLVGKGLPLTSGLTGSATMRLEQDYPDAAHASQRTYLQNGPVLC